VGTVLVQACAVEHLTAEGVCTVPIWVEKPEQVLPPLSLAEGTVISFAIVSCWTVGLLFRLMARTQQRF
jgi:hypothetical protein